MELPTSSSPVESSQKEPLFFSVSLTKLAIMSVTTLGGYEIYWLFRNWKLAKKRGADKDIMPFWRAFFAIIFVFPLFLRIRKSLEEVFAENSPKFPAGPLAILWIIIELLYKLPDPFWLLSILSFLPLLAVQSIVNQLNAVAAPHAPLNSRFTWSNWLWMIFGSILLIFAIIGTFMPPENS